MFLDLLFRVHLQSRNDGPRFKFGLLDCAHYSGDLVISGLFISEFRSVHFTVTLPERWLRSLFWDFFTKGFATLPLGDRDSFW